MPDMVPMSLVVAVASIQVNSSKMTFWCFWKRRKFVTNCYLLHFVFRL